jgi:hypothetical protein
MPLWLLVLKVVSMTTALPIAEAGEMKKATRARQAAREAYDHPGCPSWAFHLRLRHLPRWLPLDLLDPSNGKLPIAEAGEMKKATRARQAAREAYVVLLAQPMLHTSFHFACLRYRQCSRHGDDLQERPRPLHGRLDTADG